MNRLKCPCTKLRILHFTCPICGDWIEMWSNEVTGKCNKCDTTIGNPRKDLSCKNYCRYADQCEEKLS